MMQEVTLNENGPSETISEDESTLDPVEPNVSKPLRIWEVLSLGGAGTLSILILIFVINAIFVIGIEFLSLFIDIDSRAFGYLIYFINWAPLLNFPLPATVDMEQWVFSGIIVSVYMLLFFLIGIHFNPKDDSPWWNQLKGFKFPSLDGILLAIISLTTTYLLTLFIFSIILPKEISGSLLSFIDLLNLDEIIFNITQIFNISLGQNTALSLMLILSFIFISLVFSFLIQISFILVFEKWQEGDNDFSKKISIIRKNWFEGLVLHIAYPIALILFLLGGSIFTFFLVLVVNFISNGIFLLETGAWMTQFLEIMIISTLFLYPAYPALTWGIYFQNRNLLSQSKNNDKNLNNSTDSS